MFVYGADFVLFIQYKKQILDIFLVVNQKLPCIRPENEFIDHLFDIFVLIIFLSTETTEQKLASPVPLTPSVPSEPEIKIQTVSFTVSTFFFHQLFYYL